MLTNQGVSRQFVDKIMKMCSLLKIQNPGNDFEEIDQVFWDFYFCLLRVSS